MLTHCVLMCHIIVRIDRIKELLPKEVVFVSESHRRLNCIIIFILDCLLVSSCSDGKSSERKVLCVCDGTTAYADVSLVLNHQSIILC